MKLEIACFNIESVIIAAQNRADRIELCADAHLGGTTPSLEDVKRAITELSIGTFVMIRPRGGNFVYSDAELEQMKASIIELKKNGVNGFVFGILKPGNKIDIEKNKALIALAAPLPCTFHRAFDRVENQLTALEQVIDCGFKRILTSGHPKSAPEGIETLFQLVKQAGDRIIIMPGGGVRSSNLPELISKTHASEYHSSAIKKVDIPDAEEIRLLKDILRKTL